MDKPLHVLVVDDEEDVRNVVANMLVDLGYRVTVARDGKTMRAALEKPDPVDLIVLDALMPGERSETLAEHVRERNIRLVMISGNLRVMEQYQDRSDQLLWKPFRMTDLKLAVERALGSITFGQRPEEPS